MKKNFLSIAILAIVISLSSCGSSSSSFDSDVRKMADYQCKAQKLAAKDPTDEKVKKEMEELQKEMEAYGEKMRKKYEDKKDDKEMEAKAEAILKEVMEKCK
jgi:predicted transcriptional regulator